MIVTDMDFGNALRAIKDGHRVTRAGWADRPRWIAVAFGDARMTLPYIYSATPDGQVAPWTASHTDMLSADWRIA